MPRGRRSLCHDLPFLFVITGFLLLNTFSEAPDRRLGPPSGKMHNVIFSQYFYSFPSIPPAGPSVVEDAEARSRFRCPTRNGCGRFPRRIVRRPLLAIREGCARLPPGP